MRYAPLSSVSADGSRDARLLSRPAEPGCRSWWFFTRNSPVSTALVISAPSAIDTSVTWIASQYDWRAGTSGWALEYSTVPARNITRMSGSRTNPPRCRSAGSFQSTPRNARTPTSPETEANSYMFDHGTASTASARTAIDEACTSAPRTRATTDQRPMRCAVVRGGAGSVGGGTSAAGGPPAPTSTRAGAAAALFPTRPNAYSAVKPTMATAYTAMEVVNSPSERWAIEPSIPATPQSFPAPTTSTDVTGSTGGPAARSRSTSPANSAGKCPESLRASPPTVTTVGDWPSGPAPGAIRSHSRRRRTPSEPSRPTTIPTAAMSR